MSTHSLISPTSPFETRDIRSTSVDTKRSKDHTTKWSHGARPLHGIRINHTLTHPTGTTSPFPAPLTGGDDLSRTKYRPEKQYASEPKTHANKAPRASGVDGWAHGKASARLNSKCDALVDAKEAESKLSRSLLELLPEYGGNASAIHTALRESEDGEVLYSFDHKGPSPGQRGRAVDLGGLVEKAEKKWVEEQTVRIVKGEYEVLDLEGETTVLKANRKRGSPKQDAQVVAKLVDVEDEEYELV